MLQSKGIRPILKWVDDFIFFRLPTNTLPEYNEQRKINCDLITNNGGKLQTRGHLWYKGKVLTDLGAEHFREDCMFPIRHICSHRSLEGSFPFSFEEIDQITDPLGISWEKSKDTPFSSAIVFTGLLWDLDQKHISLPDLKREKYRQAISEWKQHSAHTLEDTHELYGKLLYACHIIP